MEVETTARQIHFIAGSATLVQSLMEANLIEEYRFIVYPVIMMRGKRLSKDGMDITKLDLVKDKNIDSGVVLLTYEVQK